MPGRSETKGSVWQIPKHLFPGAKAKYLKPASSSGVSFVHTSSFTAPRVFFRFLKPSSPGPPNALFSQPCSTREGYILRKIISLSGLTEDIPTPPPQKKTISCSCCNSFQLGGMPFQSRMGSPQSQAMELRIFFLTSNEPPPKRPQ